ncbi:MAG: MBL fold metallo-hydrolase, partial [Verrucomicrobiota bacterium]
MQLEDHAGDIIRKARAMSQISAAAAARAAEISETDLAALEETGRSARKINFAALAKSIGLNAQKLEAVANGWLPSPKNPGRWRELRAFTTAGDGLTVNCYLIWDAATREAALFDTGLDAQPVLEVIAAENLTLKHIFITHSHWDHDEAL